MAQQDDSQERTEQPTQKKLQQARDKGQIPRSRELVTFSMLIIAGLFFLFAGAAMVADLKQLLAQSFVMEKKEIVEHYYMLQRLWSAMIAGITMITPFLIVLTLVAVIAPMLLGGFAFSWQALEFKFEKLDPIKGMKKIVSMRGLMELAKALLKFVLVVAVAGWLIVRYYPDFLALGLIPVQSALAQMGYMIVVDFLLISTVLMLVVAGDIPFQLWDHVRNMRMTKQELREEMKDTEGKPEVKIRIRQIQREMAGRRMMEKVPQADVVITNPEHFSVALKYDQATMAAPRLVAKGTDLVALKIREIATRHHIPLAAAAPLARAIYYSTDVDGEIPVGLYLAVAQVLAYVFQLRAQDQPMDNIAMADLPIPPELSR